MSLETGIRDRLAADGTVAALVSTRIYALILPQNPTLPALTYQRISGPRLRRLTGAAGRAVARIQIDCWADTYLGAQALAAGVRASLHGYIGALGSGDVVISMDNERDLYEDESKLYRVQHDYQINHSE